MDDEQERKAILARLSLLAEMMKQHEWVDFGEEEAEEMERAEEAIDSEALKEDRDKD